RVRGRALQHPGDVLGRVLGHEPKEGRGLLDGTAADHLDAQASLAGRTAEVLGGGGDLHVLAPYFGAVARSVCLPCPRYVWGGAKSPRRWRAMFSVTYPGTCVRPL